MKSSAKHHLQVLAGVVTIIIGFGLIAGAEQMRSDVHASTEADLVEDAAVELRVMTFNIWQGGTKVDFFKVVEAIKAAGADIIGIQEPQASLPALAYQLDFYYHPELSILSRYPIVEPPEAAGHFVYVMVDETRGVAVSNVHLRAYPYGPYMLRDGETIEAVLENERYHIDQISLKLKVLQELATAGVPVFLTGDFNVPSHLDWTAAVAESSTEPYRVEVTWPVSVALEEAGFRDTYREVFPDPVAHPGYTWSPGYPHPVLDENEVHDRIDFVYAAGPSTTLASQIVGEKGPLTDIVVVPWPSDHRAVVSTFLVTPVAVSALSLDLDVQKPTITTDKDVYLVNEPILVSYAGGSGLSDSWVGIYPHGVELGTGIAARSWRWSYIEGTQGEITFGPGVGKGAVDWPLPPGTYDVHLFRDGGYSIIATTTFSVRSVEDPSCLSDS